MMKETQAIPMQSEYKVKGFTRVELLLLRAAKLVLKRRWYDMIESGEKTEEYRAITPYWIKRLFISTIPPYSYFYKHPGELKEWVNSGAYKPREIATFFMGYSKGRPQFSKEIRSIHVGTGRPEWGAEPGKEYLVITLGERIR